MATVQQQTTQLEFHQAMADFKTMFPDMDDEVIEVKTYFLTVSVIYKEITQCWVTKYCFIIQWTSQWVSCLY
jgi:hypothetical protein